MLVEMRVGELARRTGVGVSTLRAWERRFGFLAPSRSPSGQRLYDEADVEQVAAVCRLVAQGLTVSAAVNRVASTGAGALASGEADVYLAHQVMGVCDQGVWVAREGRTLYANRRMAELMGCSIDEMMARPVWDFIEPSAHDMVRERVRLLRRGGRQRYEVTLIREDGSSFDAEVSSRPLRDGSGTYQGTVGLVSDITARKQAEADARFRTALLDAIGEAVMASRPDGTIVYVNPAAEQLFGWRAAELIGQNGVEVLSTPEDAGTAQEIHSRLLARERQVREVSMTRRDGTPLVASLTGAPVLDNQGELVGLIGVLSDSGDRLRTIDELGTVELQAEMVAVLGERALRSDLREVDRVLTEIVEAVRRVLRTERAGVMEISPAGDELVVRVRSPHVDRSLPLPRDANSLPGYTVLAGKVVMIEDSNRERRFPPSPGYDNLEIGSSIAAPVFGASGVCGVLATADARPRRFSVSAVHFMQSMANIVGLLLQRSGQ